MAYGLKYYYDFADTEPMLYRVNLHEKDYTGDAAELTCGGAPFSISNRAEDKYTAINGTIFELQAFEQGPQFVGQPDFYLRDIYPEQERSIYFELRQDPLGDNTLLHKGWLVAPRSGVNIKGNQQLISFTATCGLSQLKNEDFIGVSDRKSLFETLKIILLKTGLDLPFRIATPWRWVDSTTNGHVFETKYHTDAFITEGERPKNCAYVLKQILEITNCEIFQQDGFWTIRNIELMREDTVTYSTYTKDGALIDASVDVEQVLEADKTNWNFTASSEQQIESSIRTFTATVKSGKYANIVLNSRFLSVPPFINPKQYTNWDNSIFDSHAYVGQFRIGESVEEPADPNPDLGFDAFTQAVVDKENFYSDLLGNVQRCDWTPINQISIDNGIVLEVRGKFKASGGSFNTSPVYLPVSIMLKSDTGGIYYYTANKKITTETRWGKTKADGGIFHYIPYTPEFDTEDKKTFLISMDESIAFPKIFNYFTHIAIGLHPPVIRKGGYTGNEYIDVYFFEVRLRGASYEETHEVKNANAASYSEVGLNFDFGLAATSFLENTALLVNPDEDDIVNFTGASIDVGGIQTELSGKPLEICLTLRAEQYKRPLLVFEGDLVASLGVSGRVNWSNTVLVPWLTGPTLQKFKILNRGYDFRRKKASVKLIEIL